MRQLFRSLLLVGSVAAWTATATVAMAETPECLAKEPIDCSTEWLNLLRPIAVFAIIFEDACLTHDLCYRHGSTTYGYEKAKCDDDFLADMDTICRSEVRLIDILTLGLSRVACNGAKRGFYAVVHRVPLAEERFLTGAASTCCRYDEAGRPLPLCAV